MIKGENPACWQTNGDVEFGYSVVQLPCSIYLACKY